MNQSLEEYLHTQQTIGNETRFRILDLFVDEGAHRAKELQTALDVESTTLHYHLDALVDVGLVENRTRTELANDGLYSWYRATSHGDGILERGVRDLLCEEWDFLEA